MPDGRLLVQALGGRTSTGAVSIDPADVRYAPPWIQVDDVANVVTVKYQGGAVALTDAGSVGVFDERPDEITTTIVSASDANLRAVERLSRAAYPRWIMPSCPLLRPYTFALGGMANVVSLPDASPVETWSAVVEGWTDTITGPDWEMDVALSDALQSGLVLPWNEVPVGIAWNAVPVDTDWNDATTLDAVTP
jgi:hypothetical protein